MACREVRQVAERLSVGDSTREAAERLIARLGIEARQYGAMCAVLVASRVEGITRIGLKEVWGEEDCIDVNLFFKTLTDLVESAQITTSVKLSLQGLYPKFQFEYTFYRKFDELWQPPLFPISPKQRTYAWLLFLVARTHFSMPFDLVRTALVLVGTLAYIAEKQNQHPEGLLLLASTLRIRADEAMDYYIQVCTLVQSEVCLQSVSLDASLAHLSSLLDSNTPREEFDSRLLLDSSRVRVVKMDTNTGDFGSTPISQSFQLSEWLTSVRETEETYIAAISTMYGEPHMSSFTQRMNEFRQRLCMRKELQSEGNTRIQRVIRLYLAQLLHIIQARKTEQEILRVVSNTVFHRSLQAVALECVLFAENMYEISFEEVIELAQSSPFDFWKLLVSFYSQDSTLPKPLRRHFRLIEDRIVTNLAWEREGIVHKMIERMYEEESAGEESGGNECVSRRISQVFTVFCQEVVRFAARRIYDLAQKLRLEDTQRDKIWYAVKYLLSQETTILVGRHIDQLILCTVFDVTRTSLTWTDLFASYGDLNPCELSFVSRSVRSTSSTISIEDFYNRMIQPRLREFRRLKGIVRPKIRELSPDGEVDVVAGVKETMPLRSPFRDSSLTPTSQRLYGPIASLPSDRRLDFEGWESEIREQSLHLHTILASPPSILLPSFARAVKK